MSLSFAALHLRASALKMELSRLFLINEEKARFLYRVCYSLKLISEPNYYLTSSPPSAPPAYGNKRPTRAAKVGLARVRASRAMAMKMLSLKLRLVNFSSTTLNR